MVYSYSLIDTLVTSGGTVSFNDETGNTLTVVPGRSTGLGMPKVRPAIYPKGQTDGFILGEFHLEGLHLVLAGEILIRSVVTPMSAVVTAREALIANAIAACTAIAGAATGSLNFVGGYSLPVKCDVAFEPLGAFQKDYVFGLVSASSS